MAKIGRPKEIAIDAVKIDCETQCRSKIHEDTVCDYVDLIQASNDWPFPPLTVFADGTDHLLSDGFHRFLAARRVGLDSVPCLVKQGTAKDARIYGMTANDLHGLRMTRADKRSCVEWLLEHGGRLSQAKVAELAGVSPRLVQSIVADNKKAATNGGKNWQNANSSPRKSERVNQQSESTESSTNVEAASDMPSEDVEAAWLDDRQPAADLDGEPVTEPLEGSIVRDAVGREVPSAKRKQHALGASIQLEARKLDAILRRLKELAGELGGEFLEIAAIEIKTKELKALAFGACYWSECPRCKGVVGKPCQACSGHGWWPARKHNHVSDEDKAWLGVK